MSDSDPHVSVPCTADTVRLIHLAIAVPDLELARGQYFSVLSLESSPPRELPEHGVRVSMIQLGNATIELMEPLSDASPISGFVRKHTTGGLHHLCLGIKDFEKRFQCLLQDGKLLGDETIPSTGASGARIAFLNPRVLSGVLLELEEDEPEQPASEQH